MPEKDLEHIVKWLRLKMGQGLPVLNGEEVRLDLLVSQMETVLNEVREAKSGIR